jgi:uncharacterized protein (TIGR03437 family)
MKVFKSGVTGSVAIFAFACGLCSGQSATPAPAISPNGVLNAASYTQPSFPGGALAQGTLFTVFGNNLGPATPPPGPSSFPLGTSLGGVSIKVSQGSTSVDALPFYVSASQVSAILPSNTPLGADQLVLTYNGQSSVASPITVVASSVGLFSVNSGGFGPSVVQNYVSATQLPVNSRSVASQPGQLLEMYGTGLGAALNPDNQAPTAGSLPVQTEVFVGGQSAVVAYSGRSPCCSGLDQIVFTIPAKAPLGCNVPVQVRTAGTNSSNVVTIAISADGSPCSDAVAPLGHVAEKGKSGSLLLLRSVVRVSDPGAAPTDLTMDFFHGTFQQETGGDFAFNPLYSAPPVGACTTYTYKGDVFSGAIVPGFAPTAGHLDAGKVSIANGSSSVSLKSPPYDVLLGSSTSLSGSLPKSFLDSGPFTITGGGGKGAGGFTTKLAAVPTITWANRDQSTSVTRSAGLTLNWSFSSGGGANQVVAIVGGNYDSRVNEAALFLCMAPAPTGTFTVPAAILARVPASAADGVSTRGGLIVGALPSVAPNTFAATGLDQGIATIGSAAAQFVTFQ